MRLTLTEPLKNRLPILIALLVYVAFVVIDLGLGTFEPRHLYLFPLALICFLLPIIVLIILLIALIILLWMNENLMWTMISTAIILAGIFAALRIM